MKLQLIVEVSNFINVAPRRGAWIETSYTIGYF